ncbi:MAG: M48 family metallopeptidase [Eubacterium sp.]|nr:M48 family metallopeptidase [Eubacterium sp.]
MEVKVYKSNRKTISLSVDDDLNAVVRAPYGVTDKKISEFVNKNKAWLERAIERKKAQLEKNNLSEDEINALIKTAKEIIPERVEYFSSLMNLYPTGVKITKAKKRFGSCNSKNSLCFSCFLMNYPIEAVDYVVVHELAHIRHHNHSKEFYNLIAHYMPDYKQREKLLKKA